MDTSEPFESLEDILAAALSGAGFIPSDKQRKDWRKARLIPGPVAQPGLGKTHGSTAFYPAGTGELLTVICRHSKPKKQMEDLAFLTWWDGLHVEAELLVEEKLRQCLRDWEQWSQSSADKHIGQVARVATSGRLPEPLRSIRRRIGSRRFQVLLAVLAAVASGDFRAWEQSADRDDVLAGLGLDRAKRDRVGTAAPWLRGWLHKQLAELATSIQLTGLREAFEVTIGQNDLDRARDELQALLGFLYTVKLTLESTSEPGAFGLGLLPSPQDVDHKVAPGLLLVWLAWRQHPLMYEGYTPFMQFAATGAPLAFFRDLMRSTNTEKPRQRLQPLRGMAKGSESPCSASLAPPLVTP